MRALGEADTGIRCNIGPAEIARRRRVAVASTVVTALVAVAQVLASVPLLGRALLWPFAAGSAVAWLQVTERFCVRFGALGLENFGALGAERQVARDQLAADRRRAARLIGQGVLAGLIATVAFILLPV
jgi:hypothetical protein